MKTNPYPILVFAAVLLSCGRTSPALAENVFSSVAKTVLIDDIDLASIDSGIVKDVAVKVGDRVEAGAMLMSLDERMVDHERRMARWSTAIARLEATNDVDILKAKLSYDHKVRRLSKAEQANEKLPGSVTKSELEQLAHDAEEARLSVEHAHLSRSIKQNAVELKAEQEAIAELQLNFRTIRAPISGTILDVKKQVGESISASEVAVRIVNLDRLRVVSHLELAIVDRLNVGDDVLFIPSRSSLVNHEVKAKVTFINPELNAEEGIVEVWAEFDNRQWQLFGGEPGRMVISAVSNKLL